jgi:hypothetical protein
VLLDHDDALRAMRHGAIAAVVLAALTAAAVAVALAGTGTGSIGDFADPWMILDAALMLGLAWGVHRRSRTSAVLLLLAFIAARIVLALDTGRLPFPVLSLLFAWYFARAVQGAVVHHRIVRQADPGHRPGWLRPALLAVPVVALLVMGLTVAAMTRSGSLLPSRVTDGTGLAAPLRAQLRELGLLQPDERVAWFFGHGTRSLCDGGNLVTDRRVLAWWPGADGAIEQRAIALADLRYLDLEQAGGVLEPAVYRVGSENPQDWITLVLSTERGGDQRFIAGIRERIAGNLGRTQGR